MRLSLAIFVSVGALILLSWVALSWIMLNGEIYYEHAAKSANREESSSKDVYIKDQLHLSTSSTIDPKDSVEVDIWIERCQVDRFFGYPSIPLGRKEYSNHFVLNLSNQSRRSDLIFQIEGDKDLHRIETTQWFIVSKSAGTLAIEVLVPIGLCELNPLGTISCSWRK
jgi:hypothetical protein